MKFLCNHFFMIGLLHDIAVRMILSPFDFEKLGYIPKYIPARVLQSKISCLFILTLFFYSNLFFLIWMAHFFYFIFPDVLLFPSTMF